MSLAGGADVVEGLGNDAPGHALRPVWAEVDLDALAHNVKEIRQWLRHGVLFGGSIKANAYGHGAAQVASLLEQHGVEFLMTASFADALAVRATGSDVKIIMLAACLPEAIPHYLRASLTPTVHSLAGAEAVSRYADHPTAVHVKIDAGLGRIGIGIDDAPGFVQQISRLPNVVVDGVYTHLPYADTRGEEWATAQLKRFVNTVASIRKLGLEIPFAQAASSPGVLTGLDADELTAVCVGSVLYGLPALDEPHRSAAKLRRALSSIRARLIQVSRQSQARTIGRGGHKTLAAGTLLGVVPVGILDGYRSPRDGKELQMLVHGVRVPVLGVTLGHTTLDLTSVGDAAAGDDVTVIGEQGGDEITLDEIASALEASMLEVVMGFDQRIPYEYVHAGATGRPPVGNTGKHTARY